MTIRGEAEEILRGLAACDDDDFDLAAGALALAALDRPGIGLDRYRAHLAELVTDVAQAAAGNGSDGVSERVAALNEVILQRHGYQGDTQSYEDLQNANLTRVIDRRKGLPVALGILFLHAAQAQGWDATGLNFPAHFLIRLEQGGERVIVDPFHDGRIRAAAELRELLKLSAGIDTELDPRHYQPVGNREVLLRLQNNIKARHLSAGRIEQAVSIMESMLLFAPDRSHLWRDAGVLQARLGNLGAAIASLETFVARSDHDDARREATVIIQQLRARLN